MNIVVTVKEVLDPNIAPDDLRVDESGRRVYAPAGGSTVVNGYDENALEAALQLREAHGGQVAAITLGEDTAVDGLRRALAMGANSVMLLKDAVWDDRDSAMTAAVLAAGIRQMDEPDLVLCGRQASDTDAGQVLHFIAGTLGIPSVSPVVKIEEVNDDNIVVRRLAENGYQVLRVALPAVLGISSEMNEPRYPTAKGLMSSKRAMIRTLDAADLGMAPIPAKVKLKTVEIPKATSRAELVEGSSGEEIGARLADRLHELGVI